MVWRGRKKFHYQKVQQPFPNSQTKHVVRSRDRIFGIGAILENWTLGFFSNDTAGSTRSLAKRQPYSTPKGPQCWHCFPPGHCSGRPPDHLCPAPAQKRSLASPARVQRTGCSKDRVGLLHHDTLGNKPIQLLVIWGHVRAEIQDTHII